MLSRSWTPFWFLLVSSAATAGQYVISTVAGGVPPLTPAVGTSVALGSPSGITVDGAGNVYFTTSQCVLKLDTHGVVTRVAGNGRAGFSGDGGPATSAQLTPRAVAIDRQGNLFIADSFNYRIRRISPSGLITTVAGSGSYGTAGDRGPATSAQLSPQLGVAVDAQGNLFIASNFSSVRKVSPDGIITTVAGTGIRGYSGDGGPATSAQLDGPAGLALDGEGNLYIADSSNSRIRKVSPDGIITTVAGKGTRGYSGDGDLATNAQISIPRGLAVDSLGNLFIADWQNDRVRRVSPSGIITTVAGTGVLGNSGDSGPATSARLEADDVAVDGSGNLFIADSFNNRIRKVSPDGIITTVAGNGAPTYLVDGMPAAGAQLKSAWSVAADGQGNLFINDAGSSLVRKISPGGIITTVAGGGTAYPGDGGPATNARLLAPYCIAVDGSGNLFIAESYRIRKVSPDGITTTVAGSGIPGSSGDGGPATSARIGPPVGLAVDGQGNIFFTDIACTCVRKVSAQGIITRLAGNGSTGPAGDGGLATSAQLNVPYGLAVDAQGNLLIADSFNNRVRRVSPDGIITTVVGTGSPGYSGDGGPAKNAQLMNPWGIAVDAQGNLWISDESNYRIRKVSTSGVITTVAGTGRGGYSGDGGPALSAQLLDPLGVTVDQQGNVYVADSGGVVRRLQPDDHSVLIGAVVDAAGQSSGPISPGKIVVIYGSGLGLPNLAQNKLVGDAYPNQLAGTSVSFNAIPAPILYTSATQLAAIVPYGITGATARVTVSYLGEASPPVTAPLAASAPSLFTLNQTGAGQAAAVNVSDGSINTAANPVAIGGYISMFATGEGQTTPGGIDGKIASGPVLPQPQLQISATVGGLPAVVQYAGAAPGEVAGLMQLNVQIPTGVQPGGFVPVILQVGDASTVAGAVWIAVAAKP